MDLLLNRWASAVGIDPARLPDARSLRARFGPESVRPPARTTKLAVWEQRYGFRLPRGLMAWLALSDGLYQGESPLIHPLRAIGPMVSFAQVPELVIQPESWFEVGNPGTETICIDLGYTWPGGDCPIFTSGDDLRETKPRLIESGFCSWFVRLLHEGGRAYWFDPDFASLGDPWREHRCRAPAPPLPDRLRALTKRVRPLMRPDADDRDIARSLGITRWDVEALFRYLQHAPPG
jgi:hypothetical protein